MDPKEREIIDLKDDVSENIFQLKQHDRLIQGLRNDVNELKQRVLCTEQDARTTIYHLQKYAATLQADLARAHMLLKQAYNSQNSGWSDTLCEQVEKELETKRGPEEEEDA